MTKSSATSRSSKSLPTRWTRKFPRPRPACSRKSKSAKARPCPSKPSSAPSTPPVLPPRHPRLRQQSPRNLLPPRPLFRRRLQSLPQLLRHRLPRRNPRQPHPPHQDNPLRLRVPQANAFTARRSSAAWPRSTASISRPCPAPVPAAVSASRTLRRSSPEAAPLPPRARRRRCPAPALARQALATRRCCCRRRSGRRCPIACAAPRGRACTSRTVRAVTPPVGSSRWRTGCWPTRGRPARRA